MSALDTVDEVAEKIALGFVLFLVGLMALCALAITGLMWKYATNQMGLVVGTIIWFISFSIAFAVSWTGYMSDR